MSINSRLKKAVGFFLDKRDMRQRSYIEQKQYLDTLTAYDDLVYRSYLQYKCQMHIQGKPFFIMVNAASWILYPVIFAYIKSRKQPTSADDKIDAVFNCYDIDKNILPDSLNKIYKNICFNEKMEGYYYDDELKHYIRKRIKKYKLSRYFYLKTMMKLSYYNYLMKMYPCRAIIGYSEFSFTSGALTDFCHVKHVKHINIMHGEKRFYITDAFASYDDFYVWSSSYIDLFRELNVQGNFMIEIPPSLLWDKSLDNEYIDYTYYLTNPNQPTLKRIIRILAALSAKGYQVAIRPHPRYTNIEKLKALCDCDIEIEDSSFIDIKKSIGRTKSVVSDFSTVLLQGAFANKSVIVDDVSDFDMYQRMIDLKYGFVYKKENYTRLSEILGNEAL